MKPTRNLGCLSFTLVVLLLAKECTCAVIQSPAVANESARARNENVAPMQMDDDDFVPYQGERSSLFDWMLLKTIGKTFTGNLLVSPISIKLALVLLFEGSQDQTAHELAGVMQLPVSRSGTRDRFTTILRSLKSPPPGCTLNVGTRLYVDNNILTRQRYEAIIKTFYDSDVINTNLSHTSLIAGDINMWVNNITQGNIPRMIEDDSTIKDSLMLVVNALYFKGTWRHKYFLPENTHTGRFYTDGDKSVNVEFMHTTSRLYYSESPELDAKILRIPYSGHKFAMYLVLPRTSSGTDLLIRDINPFILTKHVWLMQELQVDVLLPKFKFDFTSYLEPVLRELGIRDIFDDTAMLIGIARTRRASKHLKVSEIVQKTGIEVNENGTSGYAATVVQISNKIEAETFHANHPFVFYIEDETTGTILYIGKVANPLEKFGSTGSPKQQYPSRFNDGVGATNSPAAVPSAPTPKERYNFFNTDLQQVVNEEVDGNIIISPVSAKVALTSLIEATGGRTRQELLSTLRLPPDERTVRNVVERNLIPLKSVKNGTEIDVATRLWVQEQLSISEDYVKSLQTYYGTDVERVDFKNAHNAANAINSWVRRETRDKIESLVDPGSISADTPLLLTSTLYFKGRWLYAFEKSATQLRCFYVPNVGCQDTYLMENTARYRYAYIPFLAAEAIELPYSDRKTSMLILMPAHPEHDQDLRILSRDLSYMSMSFLLGNLQETEVLLSIPKFSIESKLDLISALTRMGIRDLFDSNANITAVASQAPLRVAGVVQNAKIEVDEDGTVAAAATGVMIVPLMTPTIQNFTANRPFLFAIVDLETNSTLFTGRFMRPQENNTGST